MMVIFGVYTNLSLICYANLRNNNKDNCINNIYQSIKNNAENNNFIDEVIFLRLFQNF